MQLFTGFTDEALLIIASLLAENIPPEDENEACMATLYQDEIVALRDRALDEIERRAVVLNPTLHPLVAMEIELRHAPEPTPEQRAKFAQWKATWVAQIAAHLKIDSKRLADDA